MTHKRNYLLDCIRGIAILVVVFGHALTSCNGMNPHTPVTAFIRAFQMPLLMGISGYCMGFVVRRDLKDQLRSKFFRLAVPYFAWLYIPFFLRYFVQGTIGLNAYDVLSQIWASPFWFLRELFVFSVVYIVLADILKLVRWGGGYEPV